MHAQGERKMNDTLLTNTIVTDADQIIDMGIGQSAKSGN